VSIAGAQNNSNRTWSELPRRATLSVGLVQKDSSGKDRFVTGGAAVLIRDSANNVFIATALHVFEEPERKWAPESLQIRNWRDEKVSRYQQFGSTLLLRRDGIPLYTVSRDLDLAVIPVNQEIIERALDDDRSLYTLTPSDVGDDVDIFDGADVFILGFPGLVGEEYQQRALMRAGIIAWTDSSSPSKHDFLVDSRIFPGNSGGPVFSSAAGMTRDASLRAGKPTRLLGLVSKTINAKPELALGMRLPNETMVIGAAGAGLIAPAREVLNLMAQSLQQKGMK